MKVRPLFDKVLVKRSDAEDKTKGGILLPDNAKEKPQRGKVLSVGEGKVLKDGTRKKVDVKKGDEILFASYSGTEIKIDDEEYLIIEESNILGIIED